MDDDPLIRRTSTTGVRVDAISGLDVAIDLIQETLHSRSTFLMTFVNPATAVLAKRHPELAHLFESFDLVAPDGIGMALAIQLLHRFRATRISFDATSLAPAVLRLAVEKDVRIVVCGGQPGVAEQARRQLTMAYPALKIIGVFDGYSDRDQTIAAIKRLRPEIVICGMGSLRQESFLLALTRSGWSGLGFTCGGFLDQLSYGLHYYPRIIDTLNLRWAYRLAKEPRRLWRRYLLDYPAFAASLCKALIWQE